MLKRITGAGPAIPDTRAAQESALKLADVGMATAIDLGDPTSPEGLRSSCHRHLQNLQLDSSCHHAGNIHPRDKQEVGRRLSLAARWIAYGDRNVNYLVRTGARVLLLWLSINEPLCHAM